VSHAERVALYIIEAVINGTQQPYAVRCAHEYTSAYYHVVVNKPASLSDRPALKIEAVWQ